MSDNRENYYNLRDYSEAQILMVQVIKKITLPTIEKALGVLGVKRKVTIYDIGRSKYVIFHAAENFISTY